MKLYIKISVLLSVIILLMIFSGCTQDVYQGTESPIDDELHNKILHYLDSKILEPSFGGKVFSAYEELGCSGSGDIIYLWVFAQEFYKDSDFLEKGTGMSTPIALKLSKDEDMEIIEHILPRDGEYYQKDIKRLFPQKLHEQILNIQDTGIIERLEGKLQARVKEEYM